MATPHICGKAYYAVDRLNIPSNHMRLNAKLSDRAALPCPKSAGAGPDPHALILQAIATDQERAGLRVEWVPTTILDGVAMVGCTHPTLTASLFKLGLLPAGLPDWHFYRHAPRTEAFLDHIAGSLSVDFPDDRDASDLMPDAIRETVE